eukprot:c14079_g1_i2.p1 GENE.c14079_g1_i2~~c14079_g1_i2.p1  ORF type:complete len:107 (-),score=27.84 c14079_g1_i2:66-386(-)
MDVGAIFYIIFYGCIGCVGLVAIYQCVYKNKLRGFFSRPENQHNNVVVLPQSHVVGYGPSYPQPQYQYQQPPQYQPQQQQYQPQQYQYSQNQSVAVSIATPFIIDK